MKSIVFIILLFFSIPVFSQSGIDSFLTPSDSVNVSRKNAVLITEVGLTAGGLIGLNQLWYKDYPQSKFHFINDNSEWLQMDKIGHFYSAYHLNRFGCETTNWAGLSKNKQLFYGAALSMGFLTTIEVFDGFSKQWGASSGDIIANVSGTGLYLSQELLWKEQRIIPKFSFHTTKYAEIRPDALGQSFNEQLFKDYNGQTYWLSFNLHSFCTDTKIPKWLNVALGYGANGMITGEDWENIEAALPYVERNREFYLSLDVDFSKIETKSHFLKTFFSVINILKVPAPTVKMGSNGVVNFHCLYF